MTASCAATIGGVHVAAFLDMLAFSEIGQRLLSRSDDGYNVLVGGNLFTDYARHPNILVPLPRLNIKSTAAGRYQFLKRTWDDLASQLKLPDFGPQSQDRACVRMLSWAGALNDIKEGEVEIGMQKCRKLWASLPGAGYGQHEQRKGDLLAAYNESLARLT